MRLAVTMPLKPRMAASDTSIAPVKSTSVSPIATMLTMDACRRTVKILPSVSKPLRGQLQEEAPQDEDNNKPVLAQKIHDAVARPTRTG